jgi:hypothetical protein
MTVGSDFVLTALAEEGLTHLFMVPGGLVDPFLPALARVPRMRPIVAAHEGGAAYMADDYARASGRFGAVLGIGGPGLTNMMTAAAAAKTDGSPVLVLSGEIPLDMEGLGEFQDASQTTLDDTALTKPITRLSETVASPRSLDHALRRALTMMWAQPQGPVHLSLTHDALIGATSADYPPISPYFKTVAPLSTPAAMAAIATLRNGPKIAVLAGARVKPTMLQRSSKRSPNAGRSRWRRRCVPRACFRRTTISPSACSAMPAPAMRPRRSSPILQMCSSCSAQASMSATPCTGRCADGLRARPLSSMSTPTWRRSPPTARRVTSCWAAAAHSSS